jgi:hypothetical protein
MPALNKKWPDFSEVKAKKGQNDCVCDPQKR